MKTIYFGGGCFWCTEAVYQSVQGVLEVIPGYMGGDVQNPSYEAVCSGMTGHAEVAKVVYDDAIITTGELCDVFFQTHDPTSLNRQGNDVGPQYRSVIFYTEESHRDVAHEKIANLQRAIGKPVLTEVISATAFYPAEKYHHNYYVLHRDAPYCQLIITPKIKSLREKFADKLRAQSSR